MRAPARNNSCCALLLLLGALGCQASKHQPFSFYDERIAPIIDVGCQRQTTGCHIDDGHGFALGNLDLSSYRGLAHRGDVLDPYGPYSVGLLLLKAGGPIDVQVRTVDPPDPAEPDRRYVTVKTDVRHGGGEGAIAQGSDDYSMLKQWIDGGHNQNGVPHRDLAHNLGSCVEGGANVDLDAAPDLGDDESLRTFVTSVQPVLVKRCAGSSCHGASPADLFLTCGKDARQQRWNYWMAVRHLAEQAVTSELLRRPLSLSGGGTYHEGGDIFADTSDLDYKTILRWAQDLQKRRPELLRWQPGANEEGLRFFANRVQPLFVRKGCMFLACHSPAMFHDLRLRGGSRGEMSEIATRRNYEMSRLMLALESHNPNDSRLIAKNLCPPASGGRGVKHRGGALLEDFGGCATPQTQASADKCKDVDADHGDLNTIPAYCVLARWHALERGQAIARGEIDPEPGPRGVVWVMRPEGIGGPTEFDAFRPGADLVRAEASVDADQHLRLGDPRSLLGGCGIASGSDVRGPSVSWDGKRIAFAARASANAPLRLYEMNVDGSACGPLAGIAPDSEQQDGILLHDFDPAYAPDGRLVFASTRGYLDGATGLHGPTRTPAALEPNANLYIFDPSQTPAVRQLTYLLDQELQPSFMSDGRVIFTAEKRGEGFHQLAGRRQNLDGGDYHPLFAQRPSIGFESATELIELANRNFAMVAAPLGSKDGGGTIVVVNRSIGPDQSDRAAGDKSYVHSLTTPVPGAFGGDSGVFRSPAPLPTGRMLASCDLQASALDAGSPHYGLCELDPSGIDPPRLVFSAPDRVAIEAAALYARVPHTFASRGDEINGSTHIEQGQQDAIVHFLDVPLLGTLLFANTRTGRPIDTRVAGLELLAPQPPPASADSFDQLGGDVVSDRYGRFYQSLRSLGKANAHPDGSLRVRIPGGMPLTLALVDSKGRQLQFPAHAPFSGPMRQREAIQFYPGERVKQLMPRHFFDGLCAGCHGSVSGRELDVAVSVDVLTSASRTAASDELRDLR
jgi:hypothetical protein